MILLVASAEDVQARRLAAQWASHDARLLTPEDLSQPGWRLQPGCASPRTTWEAIIDGQSFDERTTLEGLVNLLPQVTEEHLPHIDPLDRSYVAQEMSAFLLTWQAALACPILNRPRPNSLTGPEISTSAWLLLAAGLGIPVRRLTASSHAANRRRSADGNQAITQAITVIGDRAFGGEPVSQRHALSIARAAEVDLGTFYFSTDSRAAFIRATLRPDLDSLEVAAALLQCLQERLPC